MCTVWLTGATSWFSSKRSKAVEGINVGKEARTDCTRSQSRLQVLGVVAFLCWYSLLLSSPSFAEIERTTKFFGPSRMTTAVVLDDFNRDGLVDLVAVNRDEGGAAKDDGLRLLLGLGQGQFQDPGTSLSVRTGGLVSPMVPLGLSMAMSGDFNQDTNPDLAVLTQASPGRVLIFLGDGDGGFPLENRSVLLFGESASPTAMVVGDVDQTGTPDLAVLADNKLYFFEDPSRNSLPRAMIQLGSPGRALAVGLLNHDPIPDVVIAHDTSVYVLLGRDSFEFEPPVSIDQRAGIQPRSVAIADMDGNETQDILVVHDGSLSTASLYLGNGFGQFPEVMDIGSATAQRNGPHSLGIGDFDKDGNIDFAVVNSDFDHRNVTIFRGYVHVEESGYGEDSHLQFKPYETIPAFELPKKILEGEVVSNTGSRRDMPFDSADDEAPYALYIEDIDEDGDLDVVTANFSHHGISLLPVTFVSVDPPRATLNPGERQTFFVGDGGFFTVEFIQNNSKGFIEGPSHKSEFADQDFIYQAGQIGGVTDTVRVNPVFFEGTPQSISFDIAVLAVQPTLTVSNAGTGSGTVTSAPAGITCGSDCTEAYAAGTAVTLTATATRFSVFTGWSAPNDGVNECPGTGGTCTLSMNFNRTVTATFVALFSPQPLTVTKAGTGSGTVTSAPAGISCGSDCTEAYAYRTAVTLTASASGGCCLYRMDYPRRFQCLSRHGAVYGGHVYRLGCHGYVYPRAPHPHGDEGRHRQWHGD